MPVVQSFSIVDLKDELLNSLRANINSSDPKSRVDEETDTFSGDGTTVKFMLDSNRLSYVKTVTVDGTELEYGEEYSINWRGADIGKVELTTAPAAGADNVEIVWGRTNQGQNFIYSDFPRADLSIASFPRVGFELYHTASPEGGGAGTQYAVSYEILIRISIMSPNSKEVDDIYEAINNYLLQNTRNFYGFNYLQPRGIEPFNIAPDNTARIYNKVADYVIPRRYHIVTFA